jgi:hypothetical protein
MRLSARPTAEYALLIGISACLYTGFFLLNELLFSRLEHVEGVNWIYLPSGFRVLLVLAMNWPGAVGIMLGGWYIDLFLQHETLGLGVLGNGIVSGFVPVAVKAWMQRRRQFDTQLHDLNIFHLLHFVLLYAACNSLGHQGLWWWLDRPGAHFWVDIWPMFVGDALGAILILYGLRCLLPLMGRWLPDLRT